jgi:hypothetical protein
MIFSIEVVLAGNVGFLNELDLGITLKEVGFLNVISRTVTRKSCK